MGFTCTQTMISSKGNVKEFLPEISSTSTTDPTRISIGLPRSELRSARRPKGNSTPKPHTEPLNSCLVCWFTEFIPWASSQRSFILAASIARKDLFILEVLTLQTLLLKPRECNERKETQERWNASWVICSWQSMVNNSWL